MFIANDLNVQETDLGRGRHRARRARRIRRGIAVAAITSPALMLAFGGVAQAEAEVGSEEAIAEAIESGDLSEIVGAVEQYVLAQEAGVGDVLIKLGEHLQGT